jgi:hypothetical protein
LGHIAEPGLVDAGDSGGEREVGAADLEAVAVLVEPDPGRGFERAVAEPSLASANDRAMVKQPAWAAAISSSGLVPAPFSKREPKP